MKIVLAADHQGFELKAKIIQWLQEWGHEFVDFGPHELDPEDDYPDFVAKAAAAVSRDPDNIRGIVLGYSGQAEAMVANKYKGVRASVFYGYPRSDSSKSATDEDKGNNVITLTREDNDSNVLSLGAGLVDDETAQDIIKQWLDAPFTGKERHVRRINKIHDIESENMK